MQRISQSCGMSMARDELLGTNKLIYIGNNDFEYE